MRGGAVPARIRQLGAVPVTHGRGWDVVALLRQMDSSYRDLLILRSVFWLAFHGAQIR